MLDQVREIFTKVLSHSNDLGIFAEEIDPITGEQLGNFPQAFTRFEKAYFLDFFTIDQKAETQPWANLLFRKKK